MKRSHSDIIEIKNKKQKKIQLAPIQKITSLKCDICHEHVKHYSQCVSAFVYCSESCLEVLCLRQLNNNEKNTFEEDDEKEDDMNI